MSEMSLPPLGSTYMTSGTTLPTTQSVMSNATPTSKCCENGRPVMTDPHTGATVCSCQYNSSLLSYPRAVTGLSDGVYSSAYASQAGYSALTMDPSAFYSPLSTPYGYKETSEAWRGLTQSTTYYPYDPAMAGYPYSNSYGGMDINGARRKNATKESTNTLKAWLNEHRKNPYPTKGEKIMLAIITKMTLTQVSTWFANARRRLKKENKMTWSPRNKPDEDGDKSGNEGDDDDDDKDDIVKDSGTLDELSNDSGGTGHTLGDTVDNLDTSNNTHSFADLNGAGLPGDSLSPCSSSKDGFRSCTPRSDCAIGTTAYNSCSGTNETKPRIWSLAQTATSSTPPPLGRQSPTDNLTRLSQTLDNFTDSSLFSNLRKPASNPTPLGYGTTALNNNTPSQPSGYPSPNYTNLAQKQNSDPIQSYDASAFNNRYGNMDDHYSTNMNTSYQRPNYLQNSGINQIRQRYPIYNQSRNTGYPDPSLDVAKDVVDLGRVKPDLSDQDINDASSCAAFKPMIKM